MTRAPRQLLDALVHDAAQVILQSPPYAGQDIDVAGFAAANAAQMLLFIARFDPLRAELAERYETELAGDVALVRQLVDLDRAVAGTAASILGQEPSKGKRPAAKTQRIPKPAATVEERRAGWAARDLAEARTARDRARGQLEWAVRERDAALRDLRAAITDRDEALAIIESLRAELGTERQRSATLATDVMSAAELLASVLRPADVVVSPDTDPRDQEQLAGEPADTANLDPNRDRLTGALADANIAIHAFLAVLDVIRAPAQPITDRHAISRQREMSLTPLGGGSEIGGSCMLVEVGDVRILVDVGLRPRQPLDRVGPLGIDIARSGHLDAIVVTHAHNDHAGYVPALTVEHANLPVFCTAETAALLPTMWADSVKVFDRVAREHLSYSQSSTMPPYSQSDVVAAQHRLRPVGYGRVVEVADGVTIELFPAGHILGAAGVVVAAGSSRVTVTGDVSDLAQATVSGLVVPQSARGSDLLVIESTYCQRRSHRDVEVENFLATVLETVTSGGRVLVPAFALGRAQEVAMTLRNRLPDVPVLLDGMAKQITRIYEQQTAEGDRPLQIYGDQVREVPPDKRRQLITSFRRGVIVTTSGMLTAGPAVQWARSILPDPTSALLLAGHQDEESPGAALLELAEGHNSTFALDSQDFEVKARVAKFGLSAHADRQGLAAITDDVAANQVMLVHGLSGAQREFGGHLTRRGHHVVATERWQS
ncbi:MBL fold metallo-hydrolase [Micromonospora sp. NPDC005171]|uniref:MBL fold metallo-hydrolase n=1 Tax=Micromonospora sp. NPDC005171 TaxID=3156866 RepID=UPI00339DDD60